MKTYKVTFKLQTPISFIDVPTFDGVLAYCYAKELQQEKFVQKLSYDKLEIIDFTKMPIALHQDGYFIASSMNFGDNSVEFMEYWHKRWDNQNDSISNFGKSKRKVRIDSGIFKSYSMPISLNLIPEVWFYFQTDDIEQVKYLLDSHLVGLGKKISQGNGIIKETIIQTSDFKFNSIYRPIPLSLLPEIPKGAIRYCGWKPPYWMPDNMEACAVPK